MMIHDPSPFQHALASFKAGLEPSVASRFAKTTVQDLKQEILDIQRKQISQKRLQDMHRLHGVITAIEQYGKVIEVFLNASDILAFVWGPMKFLLQVVGSFSEAFNGLLDTYQLIGESLPLLEKCQGFLENSQFVSQALQSIYRDILDFHNQALRYFRKPLLKQIFQETWPRYKTKFGPIIDNLKRHKQLVEGRITFTQLEAAVSNGAKTLRELEAQRENNENIQHRAVRCWLNSADVYVDQENVSAVRRTNKRAGQWLLRNDAFQAWQSSSNQNDLLWLCGIPGAGKTVLASLIIDECRRLGGKTIWFYCKHGDNQRNTFVALARALISQILDQERDLLPFIYETMCCRGETVLSSDMLAKELLGIFLASSDDLYIIVDGLDECTQNEEKHIIEYLCSVTKDLHRDTQSSLRCVFVSQSDAIAVKTLRNIPKIEMKPSHNHDDISVFVKSRGSDIQTKFRISDEEIQNINFLVIKRAGGMFLYAKLVMSSLLSQVSQERLMGEIHDRGIPDGLGEAYSRVLAVALDQNSRTEALKLLGWLVCAKRQLRWREVQGAVSIDLQGFSVEFESRKWVLDSKDLCGSLVHLRSDGSLELVHSTAKSYLISSGTVNLQQEELEMASLCVGYLSFPGFYDMLDDESVKELLHNGYYAFLDYAACYWVYHLKSGLEFGINEISSRKLINCLRMFMDTHRRSPAKHVEIREGTRQVFNGLQLQSTWHDFEYFLEAFQATETQVQTFEESKLLNEVVDLPDVIKRIRKILEESQSNAKGHLTENISAFYGNELYKCPRMSCDFFHIGFSSCTQRDDHITKHSRPFGCSFPGCLRSALAFSSQKELERHTLHAHRPNPGESGHPSKRKRFSLKCKRCKNEFSNPQSLLTHECKMEQDDHSKSSGQNVNDKGTQLDNPSQTVPESAKSILDELEKRESGLKLSKEQIEEIDQTPFRLHLRENHLHNPRDVTNWGQLKKWLSQMPNPKFQFGLGTTSEVCKEHLSQIISTTLSKPQIQSNRMPPPEQDPEPQLYKSSHIQNPPPGQNSNIPGIRPITSSDVAIARQKLGPQADKFTDEQLVTILRNRQQQVLQQAAAAPVRNETITALNTLSRPPPSQSAISDINSEVSRPMSHELPVFLGQRSDPNGQGMSPTMTNTITSDTPLPFAKERAFNNILHNYGPSAAQTVSQLQQPAGHTYQPQTHATNGQMPHTQYQSQDEDHIDSTLRAPPQYSPQREDQYTISNRNSIINRMPPPSPPGSEIFADSHTWLAPRPGIDIMPSDSPFLRETSGLFQTVPTSPPLEEFSDEEVPGNPEPSIDGPRPWFPPDIAQYQAASISPPSISTVRFAPPQRNLVDIDSLSPPATRSRVRQRTDPCRGMDSSNSD